MARKKKEEQFEMFHGEATSSAPDAAETPPSVEIPVVDDTAGEDVSTYEPAPATHKTVEIISAPMNPVTLWVNGAGQCSVYVGDRAYLPIEALSALRDSDVQFKEIDE